MFSKEFFGEMKISKLFFMIAIPGAIGMLASVIYQLIEGIFISQYLGSTAFGALNLAYPYVIILFAIADLIGVGSSVIIAIRLGEGDAESANRIFTNSVIMIVIIETIFAIACYFLAPYLIMVLGAEGELLRMATEYLKTYVVFFPITSLVFAFDNYLRISGKIKTSMFLNIFGSAMIVGLEYLFIGVLNFEIWGAPLATSIVFVVMTIVAFIVFGTRKLTLKFVKPKLSINELFRVIRNGLPVFLSTTAGRIMEIIFNAILLSMGGEDAVNAYGVIMYVEALILPLLYGMVDSLQPVVGYNFGANKIDRVKTMEKYAYITSFILCLITFVFLISFPNAYASIFIDTTNEAAMNMTITAIFIFSFTYLTRWFSFASQCFLSAIEKPISSLMISLTFSFIAPVALIGILWVLNIEGIWINFVISSFLSTVLSIIILIVKNKRGTLYLKKKPL